MVAMGIEIAIVGDDLLRIARRLEDDGRGVELVDAQVEDGVIELAREPQRPELCALLDHRGGRCRWRRFGATQGEGGKPIRDRDRERAVVRTSRSARALKWLELDPLGVGRTARARR